MTENRYDDELLSAIIDGEASPETVAAVEADPIAEQRLADMRAGVESVAKPIPEASPERRSQSIAAAMAAATPASPEVTSLSAQRHKHNEQKLEEKKRRPPGWLIAAAAAILLFVLATPVLFDSGATDTATSATDTADEVAETVSGDDTEEAVEDEEEELFETEEAAEEVEETVQAEEAMEDEEEAAVAADDAGGEQSAESADAAVDEFTDLDFEVVTSLEALDLLIEDATVTPDLTSDDILSFDTSLARSSGLLEEVLATEVNPDCFSAEQTIENPTPYAVVVLDPFAGGPSLVIVEFLDDQTSRVLNAQTCAVLG